MTDHIFTDVPLSRLDLDARLLQGIAEAGFHYCTPIQAKALPLALAGQDVEGQAQTGTGKTAAFLLAAMNRVLRQPPPQGHRDGDPRILILAPTRELAVQIHADAEVLGAHTGLRMGVVFGGTGYDSQRRMLEAGLDILIGTPGRLIDYLKQRVYSLRSVQVAVIDEADRMFDLGFIKDVRFVFRRMPPPPERLNLLFSATLSYRVNELAYEHMNAPEIVDASPDKVTVDNVRQVLYHVSNEEKIGVLVGLLRRMDAQRTMVFANTRRTAEQIAMWLEANGYHSALLTGDVPQNKRLALLNAFKRGELSILVATDVAARGLHIPDVSHVFNFDLPQDPEDYVHRVGRTARVGAFGDAVSLACESYVYSLIEIEEFIGHRIPVEQVTPDLVARLERPSRALRSRYRDENLDRGGRRHESRRGERRPGSRRREAPPAAGGAARTESGPPADAAPATGGATEAGAPAEGKAASSRRRGGRRRRRRREGEVAPAAD